MSDLRKNYTGIYSLMLTPYKEDKTVDYTTYEEYTHWQVSQGVEHLFAVCGSSEMAQLTLDERLKLASLTVKNKGNTTVVATANMEWGFDAQVEEVKKMSDTGVDGLVFTTKGMGDRPDELVEYIGKLCEYTSLPVFMYEFPGLKPHLISGDTYGRLVRECGIYGIKDTTCTVPGIKEKIDQKGESCVIQANMPFLFEAFKMGSRGVMATPTTCGGAFFTRFFDAFMKGDMALAEQRFNEITLLDNCIDSGFNNSAKYLVQLQGIKGMRPINRADTPLSSARMESIKSFYNWCVQNGLMK
ncbi:MAG: dihydrodipicolinate synthase family protein [Oscillospiraceae bacterium]|nr:dihydrodipicolinate synthase family protein [Oscillospiraceae bacterium]